eukprot:TRINITY_DN119940_c2_g1_i1.p1 TRINITY_DN119940_c2_g1~~TRINITY_DN119940_c2_g1_i1.p1  ORF type:complete len:181 (-),score=67.37 TRINITY_DN119940_c2_g1_i1:809-1351(-)
MKLIVYIASSLDGFIADKAEKVDWLNAIAGPPDAGARYMAFMDRIDCILMGRKTFQQVLDFDCEWPYSKKVYILSNTLTEDNVPEELKSKAEIVSGTVSDVYESLKAKGYENVYVDGGSVIKGFLELDLIDEMIITRVAILLGGGVSLFGDLDSAMDFEVVKTEILNERYVQSTFVRQRK